MNRTIYRHASYTEDGQERIRYSCSMKAKDNNGEDHWVWVRVFFPRDAEVPRVDKFTVAVEDEGYSYDYMHLDGQYPKNLAVLSCIWINRFDVVRSEKSAEIEEDFNSFSAIDDAIPF